MCGPRTPDAEAGLVEDEGVRAGVGPRTYYSHGAKECDDYILGRMAIHLIPFLINLCHNYFHI
jgi:hypothetical protein